MSISFWILSFFSLSFLIAKADEKPPQFVMLAFDGSLSAKMWKATTDFSEMMEIQTKKPFQFTYFVSGVYFLSDANKNQYLPPQHKPGKSAIGFGGTSSEIANRVHLMNLSYLRGNEMASHANGHFDGSLWSFEDWKSELSQFVDLIFNYPRHQGLHSSTPNESVVFSPSQIRGFRAPLLGTNSAMISALQEFQFQYDTSLTSAPQFWPKKNSLGLWSFPLAVLRIPGTAKRTLSMDYNFYMTQTQAHPGPIKLRPQYEQEMYDTYMNYFEKNYSTHRAPVHIGHHFSLWNGGAYWKALKRFAQTVCGLPDVRCVAYRELVHYLEQLDPTRLKEWQVLSSSLREKEAPPLSLEQKLASEGLDIEVNWFVKNSELWVQLSGSDLKDLLNQKLLRWRIEGLHWVDKVLSTDSSLFLGKFSSLGGAKKVLLYFRNKEILTSSLPAETKPLSEGVIEDMEATALKGDLPQAHWDEPQ